MGMRIRLSRSSVGSPAGVRDAAVAGEICCNCICKLGDFSRALQGAFSSDEDARRVVSPILKGAQTLD